MECANQLPVFTPVLRFRPYGHLLPLLILSDSRNSDSRCVLYCGVTPESPPESSWRRLPRRATSQIRFSVVAPIGKNKFTDNSDRRDGDRRHEFLPLSSRSSWMYSDRYVAEMESAYFLKYVFSLR